jgi:hypothetical protein
MWIMIIRMKDEDTVSVLPFPFGVASESDRYV